MKLFQKIKDAINASILCIRFPFLYPRNRWDGKHHVNLLSKLRSKLYKQSIQEIIVTGKLNREGKNYYDKVFFFDYSVKLDRVNEKLTIRNKIDTKEFDISKQILWKDFFEIDGIDLKFSWMGYPIITCQVSIPEDDKTPYGFSYNEVKLITNKRKYRWYRTIKWIDEKILDNICIIPTYTELDAMPEGWRKAFGIQMCKELKKELKKHKFLYKYRITQIKEKFGGLRWYDTGSPKDSEIWDIIDKYTQISYRTCIVCGKPATKISKGWISPFCDDCIGDKQFTEINKNPFAN